MEITISNFGPIDNITFDFSKSFHLIYGRNSIGKSYATYCLYCVMKNIAKKNVSFRRQIFRDDKTFDDYRNSIKSILKGFKSNGVDSQKLVDFASSFIQEHLQLLLMPGITTSLSNTFSNLQLLKNAKTNLPYSIKLKWDDNYIDILSDEKGLPYLGQVSIINNWEFIEKKTKSTKYTLLIDSKKSIGTPTEEAFVKEFIIKLVDFTNEALLKMSSNIKDVYYLPASRSGLYQALSSFTPILAELTQNRFFLNSKKIELPSLSEPLSDYFIDISTINQRDVNEKYIKIIDKLERNILDGTVRFDELTQKIKYKPFNLNFELDISEVSSMVSELAPIVIFLRHILHHKFSTNRNNYDFYFYEQQYNRESGMNDIIFIEEPEAHLHPEVQVKLMEIFAELTKHNIKIVMTSHSNYMFNKINNIILKNELDRKDIGVYHLIRAENGSIVNEDMNITEDGINDDNFTDVSKLLYEERLRTLEE